MIQSEQDIWINCECIDAFEKNKDGKTIFIENENYYLTKDKTTKINFAYISKYAFDESFVLLQVIDENILEWKRDPISEIEDVKSVYFLFKNHGYIPISIEVTYEDVHLVSPDLKDKVENKKIRSYTVDCSSRKSYYMAEWLETEPHIIYQF